MNPRVTRSRGAPTTNARVAAGRTNLVSSGSFERLPITGQDGIDRVEQAGGVGRDGLPRVRPIAGGRPFQEGPYRGGGPLLGAEEEEQQDQAEPELRYGHTRSPTDEIGEPVGEWNASATPRRSPGGPTSQSQDQGRAAELDGGRPAGPDVGGDRIAGPPAVAQVAGRQLLDVAEVLLVDREVEAEPLGDGYHRGLVGHDPHDHVSGVTG